MQQKSTLKDKNDIIIYTDGSSLGNPGKGGYGAVIVFQKENRVIELGDFSSMTTNNKMELTAIIESLTLLEKEKVSPTTSIVIHTDSAYAINGITKWIHGWKKKNWITSTKTSVLNADLWKRLDRLNILFSNIIFNHVRGHVGVFGNEKCDTIATSFAKGESIKLYEGSLTDYDQRILFVEKSVSSSEKKQKTVSQKNTGKAHSYVSVIGSVVEIHKTWESCKQRVDGKNAKFKKVFSDQEEKKLIQEWNRLS
jgi:ribonuclease HI